MFHNNVPVILNKYLFTLFNINEKKKNYNYIFTLGKSNLIFYPSLNSKHLFPLFKIYFYIFIIFYIINSKYYTKINLIYWNRIHTSFGIIIIITIIFVCIIRSYTINIWNRGVVTYLFTINISSIREYTM